MVSNLAYGITKITWLVCICSRLSRLVRNLHDMGAWDLWLMCRHQLRNLLNRYLVFELGVNHANYMIQLYANVLNGIELMPMREPIYPAMEVNWKPYPAILECKQLNWKRKVNCKQFEHYQRSRDTVDTHETWHRRSIPIASRAYRSAGTVSNIYIHIVSQLSIYFILDERSTLDV